MNKASLKRLERRIKQTDGDPNGTVLEWIRQRRRYNELTDDEREQYKRYKESIGGVADDIAVAELKIMFSIPEDEAYSFPLSKRQRPPTPEEHTQTVKEMEMLMKEIQDEYNSPEETKKREEEYQRIQEIGRLRKQAFERGEDMSAYPLPWQTNK